jgi:hypothetical protein
VRVRRSIRIRQWVQDTLWLDAIVFVALVALVAVFGFPIWLLIVVCIAGYVMYRRSLVAWRRQGRATEWARRHDDEGHS